MSGEDPAEAETHLLCDETFLDALLVTVACISMVLVLGCLIHFLVHYCRNHRHAAHLQTRIPRRFVVLFLLMAVSSLVAFVLYIVTKLECTGGEDTTPTGPVYVYHHIAGYSYWVCADCLQLAIILRLLMMFGPQSEQFPISRCLKRGIYGLFVAFTLLTFLGLAVGLLYPLLLLGMLLYLGNWILLCTLFVVRGRKSERERVRRNAETAAANEKENEYEYAGHGHEHGAQMQTRTQWKLIQKHTLLTVVSFTSSVVTYLVLITLIVVAVTGLVHKLYVLAVLLDIATCIDLTTNVICVYFQFSLVDKYYRYFCDRKSLLDESEEQERMPMPAQSVDQHHNDNDNDNDNGDQNTNSNIKVEATTATAGTDLGGE